MSKYVCTACLKLCVSMTEWVCAETNRSDISKTKPAA